MKSAAGAMSFIFCDSETGEIVDIVEDRRLPVLKEYFLRYSKKARDAVKTIVIDMYSPYISKKFFLKRKSYSTNSISSNYLAEL
nr:transposase [Ureibacillus thermophilus]